jgi:hypothetical protein
MNIVHKIETYVQNKKNYLFKKPFFKIWEQFLVIMKGYCCYRRICLQYGNDSEYLIAPAGTGDIFIIARFYHQWLSIHPSNYIKTYLVVTGKSGKCIAEMYGLNDNIIISNSDNSNLIRLWMYMGTNSLHGRVLHWGVAMQYTSILHNLAGIHHFNMYSMFQYFVFDGIEEIIPKLDVPIDQELLDSTFQINKLKPGRTVLLVPYSNSIGSPLPVFFWESLVDGLKELGFSVCTNSTNEKETPIRGTISLAFPLEQINYFLEKAGYLISVRTGLADITVMANCKRIVLYPLIEHFKSACSYHEMFSINKMFKIFKDSEIIYLRSEPEKILPVILKEWSV